MGLGAEGRERQTAVVVIDALTQLHAIEGEGEMEEKVWTLLFRPEGGAPTERYFDLAREVQIRVLPTTQSPPFDLIWLLDSEKIPHKTKYKFIDRARTLLDAWLAMHSKWNPYQRIRWMRHDLHSVVYLRSIKACM